MSQLRYHLNQIKRDIRIYQKQLVVEVSDGVNEILSILIKETLERRGLSQLQPYFIDFIKDSVKKILFTMKNDPSEIDEILNKEVKIPVRNYRSSLSLIKSLSKNFCNIPPFCGRGSNYL